MFIIHLLIVNIAIFIQFTRVIFRILGHLQSLDWTSGLDWWTDTKNNFYAY